MRKIIKPHKIYSIINEQNPLVQCRHINTKRQGFNNRSIARKNGYEEITKEEYDAKTEELLAEFQQYIEEQIESQEEGE